MTSQKHVAKVVQVGGKQWRGLMQSFQTYFIFFSENYYEPASYTTFSEMRVTFRIVSRASIMQIQIIALKPQPFVATLAD